MRQRTIITKLLQSVTGFYYVRCQVLQCASGITKWDVTGVVEILTKSYKGGEGEGGGAFCCKTAEKTKKCTFS